MVGGYVGNFLDSISKFGCSKLGSYFPNSYPLGLNALYFICVPCLAYCVRLDGESPG